MSYILDALKKIEHEKNRRNRPDGRISISGDLFQERNRPPAGVRIWKIVVLISVAALVAAAGTWLVLKGNSQKSAAVPPVSAPPLPAPVTLAAPVLPQAAPVPSQPPSVTASPAVPSAAVPAQAKRTETAVDEDNSPREVRSPKQRVKAPHSSSLIPSQTVPAPADIKLSGIAWQDERSSRRAVINGYLLREGAVVSGAKIIDIKADRVRFSTPSGEFELKLDSVLPAGGKQ